MYQTNRHNQNFRKSKSTRYKSKKLYDLIRNRTLASQMEDEISETTTVILKNEDKSNSLKATGRVVIFEGFRKAFSYDENEEINNNENKELPIIEEGKEVITDDVVPQQHFTQAKPRYSEATLVKKMVDLGIEAIYLCINSFNYTIKAICKKRKKQINS